MVQFKEICTSHVGTVYSSRLNSLRGVLNQNLPQVLYTSCHAVTFYPTSPTRLRAAFPRLVLVSVWNNPAAPEKGTVRRDVQQVPYVQQYQ